MALGTVAKFFDDKGFGFITPEGGGRDVFVHYTDIQMDGRRTLKPGQQVTFEIATGDKGPKAANVVVTD
ncbi:MAG TPA: cold shock domain-containing protein [Phycisphaerales bacterium]|nr:cold shock domain-containing protein [Phycisphaerales bacterium]HMP36276.1 cold shock domain-containing protein [Phycisphaerales bacterium]